MALQTKTISANGSKGHHKFTLTVVENSISTANNTSSVSYTFTLSPIKTGYDWSYSNTVPVSYSITIGGNLLTGVIYNYDGKSTITLENQTISIAHNTDGSKSISYSFSVESLNVSYLTGSASASGTMDLTKIARQATILTANDFNDEQNPSLTFTNTGNYPINARLEFAGTSIHREGISNTGSYTFTLTDAERKLLRQKCVGKSMTVRFVVGTKINSTSETHWSWLDKTMTIVNDMPTLNPTVVDTGGNSTALTGNANTMIKYFNVIAAKSGITLKKEATLAAIKIINGNDTRYSDEDTFINTSSNTFVFKISDSRGNSVEKTITLPMVSYVPLTCAASGVMELSADQETKAKITLNIKGNCFTGSFGAVSNEINFNYYVYDSKDDEVFNGYLPIEENDIRESTYEKTLEIPEYFDYQESYRVVVSISDRVNQGITAQTQTLSAIPVFDWGKEDFKFNVPVTIKNVELDYVIEQGTKNGWFYRKWSSGLAECWLTTSVSGIDVGEFNMNGFYYCGSKGVNFPFTFTSINFINACGGSTGNMNIVRPFNYSNSNMTYIVMGMADISSATITVNLEAKGRWK